MKTNTNEKTNLKAIQTEMMARRRELIDAQKKQGGGCGAIQLKSDNLLFCYNPHRTESKTNPLGEKFYVTGTMNGCPVIVNEFTIYEAAQARNAMPNNPQVGYNPDFGIFE